MFEAQAFELGLECFAQGSSDVVGALGRLGFFDRSFGVSVGRWRLRRCGVGSIERLQGLGVGANQTRGKRRTGSGERDTACAIEGEFASRDELVDGLSGDFEFTRQFGLGECWVGGRWF